MNILFCKILVTPFFKLVCESFDCSTWREVILYKGVVVGESGSHGSCCHSPAPQVK